MPKRQGAAVAAIPPGPGEGAAAEASPAADGPPPAQVDGDALIAEMAFSVSGEPDGAAGPMRQGHDDGAATAGDAGPPSPPSGTPAAAKPPVGGRAGGAAPRGRR